MVSFNYNNGEYLEAVFTKTVDQYEIIHMISSLVLKSDAFPTNLNILIDSRNGTLSLKKDHLYNILNENLKMSGIYRSLNVAMVMNRPMDTALAMIYARLAKLNRYHYQVFSTRSAAETWLCEKKEFDSLIQKN